MGKWAQYRKRGTASLSNAALPPGPNADDFYIDLQGDLYFAQWTSPNHGEGPYWETRWREQGPHNDWTVQTDGPAATVPTATNDSPLTFEQAPSPEAQARWCDGARAPLSQWGPTLQAL